MKSILASLGTFACLLASLASQATALEPGPIPAASITAFQQQKTTAHVLTSPDYFCWGLTVTRWTDGMYHGYYARWPKATTFAGWMTHCEIAHAVADRPEGPFVFQGVAISSRHPDGWDRVNAHNPSVCIADGTIYLYYISNNLEAVFDRTAEQTHPSDEWLKANRDGVRNSQCIGVASSRSPAGPFIRHPTPVVVPDNRLFKNIAVNPAVIFRDRTFTMIAKGDDATHEETFRVQLVGHAAKPAGPFLFQPEPMYAGAQTEDACIWFDQSDDCFHCIFHVLGKPHLVQMLSTDGRCWTKAEPFIFMDKQFQLADGTSWRPKRLERPFVLTDTTGRAAWLYTAASDTELSGNIAVPLQE